MGVSCCVVCEGVRVVLDGGGGGREGAGQWAESSLGFFFVLSSFIVCSIER